MHLIQQSHDVMNISSPEPLRLIEDAGRTCYKSEDRITRESSMTFAHKLLSSGHHSVIEHANMTVRFITNRGVTHELVRHRLCAFSQESTRYVRYEGDGAQFVRPVWMDIPLTSYFMDDVQNLRGTDRIFIRSCLTSIQDYRALIEEGWRPEQAREVLSNAVKTEIVVTANFREWRHIFTLRTSKKAHPNMREMMHKCLQTVSSLVPVIFDDLWEAVETDE